MSKEPYQVRVHIIEARGLVGKHPSGFSNPITFVTVGSQEQFTIVHKETTACVWDHLMFFDQELTKEEFNELKVKINIKDQGDILTGDQLIGLFELDAAFVYKQKNHEVSRRWVGLMNPENPEEHGKGGCTGYLKLSVGVYGAGDEPVVHGEEDDEGGDAEDLSANLLTAPDIRYQHYKLLVRVYRCENIAKVDPLSGCDPFVSVNFGGRIETKVKKNSLNPTFNTELIVPAVEPSMTDTIRVTLEDYNSATSAILVGSMTFSFAKVKTEEIPPTYFHVYGQAVEEDRVQQVMNVVSETVETAADVAAETLLQRPKQRKGVDTESAYRGTILLGMSVEKCDQAAKFGSRGTGQPKQPPDEMWTLWFDVYEANELPGSGMMTMFNLTEVQVELCLGPHKVTSARDTLKNGRARWYKSLEELKIRLPSDPEQLPDIFINVYSINTVLRSRVRLGYCRLKASAVSNMECPAKWHELKPDPQLVGEIHGGFILFGVGLTHARNVLTPRKKIRKPQTKKYEMRVHVYQARNLTAADEEGTSDPYVIARCAGISHRTVTKYKMNSPRWYTSLCLGVDLAEPLTLAPDLQIIVMDEDAVLDDLIGRCSIPVARMNATQYDPKWYNIYAYEKSNPEGQVLLSLQLIPVADLARMKLTSIVPKMKDCIVEVQCLGVRGLLPYLLQEIEEPQLVFTIGDKSEQNKALKKTKFSKRPNGTNANFLENLFITAPMPMNPIYSPSLDVSIIDSRLLKQVEVGAASYWLGEHLPWITQNDLDAYNEVVRMEREETVAAIETTNQAEFPMDLSHWNEDIPDDMIENVKEFMVPESDEGGSKKSKRGQRFLPEVDATHVEADDSEKEGEGQEGSSSKKDEKKEPEAFDDDLETMLSDLPFRSFTIFRGQGTETRNVGCWKGNIRVYELSQRSRVRPVNIKEQFKPRNLKIRLYIYRGIDLSPVNRNGSADPFLSIVLGDGKGATKMFDTLQKALEDTLEPDFYESVELTGVIPGDSEVVLSIYSRGIGGLANTLMGQTKIDLENRYFCEQWRAMKPKLRENRTLHKPGSLIPKGKLEVMVDMLTPEEAMVQPMTMLTPPMPQRWQLRVVIWHTFEVPCENGKSIDIFVTAEADGYDEQETDTHLGVSDGKGNFNYRMVWDIEIPNKKAAPRLKLAVWDLKIFGANEAIGEAVINLKAIYSKAVKKQQTENIKRQTIICRHPTKGDQPRGKIDMQISLVPGSEAADYPVGKGRGSPNENPFLPDPERPSLFSLTMKGFSFDMFGLGAMKKKCMICCCITLVLVLILEFGIPSKK